MARTVRDKRLDTRAARQRLPPCKQPHWREISQGAHLGYYRGKRVAKWLARYRALRSAAGYVQVTLGISDDVEDADGLHVLSFAQAQEKARSWFRSTARGVQKLDPYSVADALSDYVTAFRGKSLAATKNKIDSMIEPVLGIHAVEALTTQQIARWHRDLALAPARSRTSKHAPFQNHRPAGDADQTRQRRSTANRHLSVLKAALNQAFREGKVESDLEWRKVRPFPNVESARLRYLSDEEARALVGSTSADFRPMVLAALLTGARYGDLCAVRVSAFDRAAGTLLIANSKGDRPYVAYLSDEAQRFFLFVTAEEPENGLMFRRDSGGPWGVGHQHRRLQAAAVAAGLAKVGFHDLRRTFGARLAMRGVPMAVIAEVLGHSDERTTRRHYAHLAPSYVADPIRKQMADFGIVTLPNLTRPSTEAA